MQNINKEYKYYINKKYLENDNNDEFGNTNVNSLFNRNSSIKNNGKEANG